jgi:acyl carrier protein
MAGDALVAYVAATASEAELRQGLSRTLPDFMVPARFVMLGALPLTPTGKVDLLALHEPAQSPPRLEGGEPRTVLEKQIATAWCGVLGVAEIGREVNFFDAGGDSLRLAKVQRELESALGLRIPLTDLLAHPSVGALATRLEEGHTGSPAAEAVLERMGRRRSKR